MLVIFVVAEVLYSAIVGYAMVLGCTAILAVAVRLVMMITASKP
jgi:hypothetical protein